MKKAKIMLTGIAVLAIVSGALAFKAKSNHVLYLKDGSGHCTIRTTGATTTDSGGTNVDYDTQENTTGCSFSGLTTTINDNM